MKKLVINSEQCISCGACVAIDPDHFEFDDNGLSVVISQEDLASVNLANAIESCPVAVIYTENISESSEKNTTTTDNFDGCNCAACENHCQAE